MLNMENGVVVVVPGVVMSPIFQPVMVRYGTSWDRFFEEGGARRGEEGLGMRRTVNNSQLMPVVLYCTFISKPSTISLQQDGQV